MLEEKDEGKSGLAIGSSRCFYAMEKIIIEGICIRRFQWDFINSNMYVIEEEGEILAVDPVQTEETDRFWEERKDAIRCVTVILTHEHFDHINGLNHLRELYGCIVLASEACGRNIRDTRKNLSEYSELLIEMNEAVAGSGREVEPFVCGEIEVLVEREMEWEWMGRKLKLMPAPGHSEGSMCVLMDGRVLFTGDSLLEKKIITRLPGGSRRDYEGVTRGRLRELVERAEMVLPGHGMAGGRDVFGRYV